MISNITFKIVFPDNNVEDNRVAWSSWWRNWTLQILTPVWPFYHITCSVLLHKVWSLNVDVSLHIVPDAQGTHLTSFVTFDNIGGRW